jgi:hypothetical protein
MGYEHIKESSGVHKTGDQKKNKKKSGVGARFYSKN